MPLSRETSAGYLSNWAARLFARELERQLAPSGIASAYMPILFALAEHEQMTQKALAERAAVEQPTMAATLNRMERDGFCRRRPDPVDRRSALVSLTERARAAIATVERVVDDINATAFADLSPNEADQFVALHLKVIEALHRRDAQF